MPKLVEADKLMHENDGLIFTVDDCPYYPGTCEQIWKWKPIEQNSIDFVLRATVDPMIFQLRTRDDTLFSYIVLTSSS
jgi:hypothetical protein